MIIAPGNPLQKARRKRRLERDLSRPAAIFRRQFAFVGSAFSPPVNAPLVIEPDSHALGHCLGSNLLKHFSHWLARPDTIRAWWSLGEQLANHAVSDLFAGVGLA